MEAELQAHVAFFLTGRMPSGELDAVDRLDLRPALFAGYRDLTPLRYDFPLVLVADARAAGAVAFRPVRSARAKDIAGKRRRRTRCASMPDASSRKSAADRGRHDRQSVELWDIAAARIGAKNDDQLRKTA